MAAQTSSRLLSASSSQCSRHYRCQAQVRGLRPAAKCIESELVGRREDILDFLSILAEKRFCGDLFLRDLDGA